MMADVRKARFENRPLPKIEDPQDVLIRVSYVGVCGSDVMILARNVLTDD